MDRKLIRTASDINEIANICDDLDLFSFADEAQDYATRVYALAGVPVQNIANPGAIQNVQPLQMNNPQAEPGLTDEQVLEMEQEEKARKLQLQDVGDQQEDVVEDTRDLMDDQDLKKQQVMDLAR